MTRQPGFEKLYAKMHDIDPEDLVQYRFGSKDGYRLPQMASHYRLYCETIDSLAGELCDAARYQWLMSDAVMNGTLGIDSGWIDFGLKDEAAEIIDRAMQQDAKS